MCCPFSLANVFILDHNFEALDSFTTHYTLIMVQVALTGTQIYWTVEVTAAFARLEEGYENALRDYYRKQVSVTPT